MAQAGLVAAYGFEEGRGATVADTSGSHNRGSIQGATWTAEGKYGNALSFDGATGYVSVASPSLPTGDYTWAAWVNPDRTGAFQGLLVSRGIGVSPGGLELDLDAGGHLLVWSNGTLRLTSTATISAGVWSHVALARSGGSIALHVNGVLDAKAGMDHGAHAFSACPLLIGVDNDSGCAGALNGYFAGRLDEIRIYDRALSASEIRSDANTPVSESLPPSAPARPRVETILFVDGAPGPSQTAGFRLHLGSQPGVYSSVADIGLPPAGLTGVRAYTFEVDREATPHIALTAYDVAGRTSSYSNEIERSPRRPAFDHDGRGTSDLLLVDPSARALRLVRSDGSTALAAPGVAAPQHATIAAQGDFDGDGTTDVLWSRQETGQLTLWLLDPGGAVRIAQLTTTAPGLALLGSGDLDGDADADLVFGTPLPGALLLWFMEGGAVGERAIVAGLRKPWSLVGIGDVDADRRADLVWRHKANGRAEAWLMNGTSVLEEVEFQVAKEWETLGLGDYDGDGASDLVLRHRQDGRLEALSILDGAAAGTPLATGPVPGSGLALGLDFDGDGFADLVRVDPFRRLAHLQLLGPDAPSASVDLDLALIALPADFARETGDRDNDWSPDYCDADFDNDGVVGFLDLRRTQECFGKEAIAGCFGLDLDGDDLIGFAEVTTVQRSFGAAPCSHLQTP